MSLIAMNRYEPETPFLQSPKFHWKFSTEDCRLNLAEHWNGKMRENDDFFSKKKVVAKNCELNKMVSTSKMMGSPIFWMPRWQSSYMTKQTSTKMFGHFCGQCLPGWSQQNPKIVDWLWFKFEMFHPILFFKNINSLAPTIDLFRKWNTPDALDRSNQSHVCARTAQQCLLQKWKILHDHFHPNHWFPLLGLTKANHRWVHCQEHQLAA